jgi:ribonuclease P protein component
VLPKKNRLDRKTLAHVFKKGATVGSRNLTLRSLRGENKIPRLAFVVPKGAVQSSVRRNFLRRRGYGAAEKLLTGFPASILGVFIFGRNSEGVFGSKKNGPTNLQNEIKFILSKL